jgi:hypothetical protein
MSSINEKVRRVPLNNPGYGILACFEHELVVCCLLVSKSITRRPKYTKRPAGTLGGGCFGHHTMILS